MQSYSTEDKEQKESTGEEVEWKANVLYTCFLRVCAVLFKSCVQGVFKLTDPFPSIKALPILTVSIWLHSTLHNVMNQKAKKKKHWIKDV